jgi:hypothetical protein
VPAFGVQQRANAKGDFAAKMQADKNNAFTLFVAVLQIVVG